MNDDQSIQKIDWDSMRRLIVGSSNLSNSSVGGKNDHWSLLRLKGSVKKTKALNIQHVNLVNKEDSWDKIRLVLLLPLGDL